MKFDELRNQPILLFPTPKNEVHFADKDHVWINGRQYISLKRVGEMMKEKRMTNADRIRAMTDEELERFLSGVHNNIGSGRAQISVWNNNDRPIRIWRIGWLDWLKQESTNES